MDEIENLKSILARIPNIGNKAAYKIVYYLLESKPEYIESLVNSVSNLKKIKKCRICFNYSKDDICEICQDKSLDSGTMCIVEKHQDVKVFQDSGYLGRFHVLGGLLSPIDGITPDKLKIDHIIERIKNEKTKEIILAIKSNTEGDSTALYIKKTLEEKGMDVKMSKLALGIQIGREISGNDRFTISEAIKRRYNLE